MARSLTQSATHSEAQSSFICNLLLFIILAYAAKGTFYSEGILSIALASIELAICSWYMLVLILKRRVGNVCFALIIITLLVTFSYLVSPKLYSSVIIGNVNTFAFFREFCGAILPFFPFYYFARNNDIDIKSLQVFYIAAFILTVLYFFYSAVVLLVESHSTNATINVSYKFLYLLPFATLFRRKWIFLLFYLLSFTMVILGAKRGAMIGLIIQGMVYTYYTLKNSKHKLKICLILLSLLIVIFAVLLDYYNSDPFFQMRVDSTLEGKTSGRDTILQSILRSFSEGESSQMILGNGFASTIKAAGNYAHNDWMEFLYDFGFAGLIVYVTYNVVLFRKGTSKHFRLKLPFYMLVYSLLFCSFFSMVFFTESASTAFILIGYICGVNSSNLKKHTTIGITQHHCNIQNQPALH